MFWFILRKDATCIKFNTALSNYTGKCDIALCLILHALNNKLLVGNS